MKFGETFTEYLRGDREGFLGDCSHVEYKRLKKVLKGCRSCREFNGSDSHVVADGTVKHQENASCGYDACPICDQMFFAELMKEASDVSGCFSMRVRHLLDHHVGSRMQRCLLRFRQCFTDDQYVLLQQGRLLMEYVTMNAIAIRKILKKYDKVHGSVSGKNFRSKLRAEHIELLQSPWLMELGAFYLNLDGANAVEDESDEFFGRFSFHFNVTQPVIRMSLPDSMELEYDLTCAICLDTVFNPYALSCGHFFCKLCACSAASLPIFQGLKTASDKARCPVCRELTVNMNMFHVRNCDTYVLEIDGSMSSSFFVVYRQYSAQGRFDSHYPEGVYANSVPLSELDLLLKKKCKEYWKERMVAERAEMVKQSKDYWSLQTKYAIGY